MSCYTCQLLIVICNATVSLEFKGFTLTTLGQVWQVRGQRLFAPQLSL